MKTQCREAVQQAAGRVLSDAEIRRIEERLSQTMRQMGRQDPPGWASKSRDQRVREATTQAMADIQAEAARKVQNAQLQIAKTMGIESRINDLMPEFQTKRSGALAREMDQTASYIEGVKRENMSHMVSLMEASKSGDGASYGRKLMMFLFDVQNPKMTRDLVHEIFSNADGSTGNRVAAEGAKAWLSSIESMRQRFNAGGGDVGKLDYGYIPQPHDQARVLAAGGDKWTESILPLLDRSRYVLEDGSRMDDTQVRQLLGAAWETISRNGMNKTEPGGFKGSGAVANAGSESRQIHFKDGDSYLEYMSQYGGGSMYDAMVGHIGGLSRDIGLVERYGPNPAQQMRLQFDLAQRADPTFSAGVKGSIKQGVLEGEWAVLSGAAGMAKHADLAKVGQDIRNIQVFGKLAGAVLSSLTDVPTYFVTAGYNKLSYWDAFKNIGKQFDGDTRDFLTMHGVIADSMISDLNRWSGENIRNNWSGRLANSTMKLSLMNAWTDTLRRAFSMTMMNGLGKLSKTEWGKLSEWDRTHLARKGITEADWQVIRSGKLTAHDGADFLTPEAIRASGDARADEVVAKVLGLITDESEYAVLNPDLLTKSMQSAGGLQKGTGMGELARSVMQFKSFPIAMISRHWRRVLDAPIGAEGAPRVAAMFGPNAPELANRLFFMGALGVSLTVLGGIAFQTKQVVAGKDPVDTTTPKFWVKALAQGGGLGFFGDVLLRDSTEDRSPQQGLFELLGPSAGSAAGLYELTKGNYDEWKAGKDTHAGAEAVRFSRGHLPYLNLWYARAAIDHAFLHSIQEGLSPGYLSRIQQRARKEWDQDSWWKPGTGLPDRAPDFSAVAGK